jgi:hypothetical protein
MVTGSLKIATTETLGGEVSRNAWIAVVVVAAVIVVILVATGAMGGGGGGGGRY